MFMQIMNLCFYSIKCNVNRKYNSIHDFNDGDIGGFET